MRMAIILLFLIFIASLISCAILQPKTEPKTANRSITMTNQQQTDSIVSHSNQLKTIFKMAAYLDKNFKKNIDGTIGFADTIYLKVLYIGHDANTGIDTLIIRPPRP